MNRRIVETVSEAGARRDSRGANEGAEKSVPTVNDGFVANGRARWWAAEGSEERRRIAGEVESRYRDELRHCGWYRRLQLRARMREEIVAELRELVPPPETLWFK